MKSFVKPGKTMTITAAPYAVASGAGVQWGKMFGVAVQAIASGATGEAETEGVFNLAALGPEAWTEGAKIYWDDTSTPKRCTTTVGANLLIGHAAIAKANAAGALVGQVRLSGAPT